MRETASLDKILVLDFGAQYAHLISRRVRELGVYSELVPPDITLERINALKAKGLIFSGGPKSVYDRGAPLPRKEIYSAGLPILGICYGLQVIVHQNGGKVSNSSKREYGKSAVNVVEEVSLFNGVSNPTTCWMSHGDKAEKLPSNFEVIGESENSPYAAIASGKLYAVQFHPEVSHTSEGMKMLSNFVFDVCGCEKNWTTDAMIEDAIAEIKEKIGSKDRVLLALSGGVDSSTAAKLLERAIGKRLTCVFVDHGLLRKGERKRVELTFRKTLGRNLVVLDESKRFLSSLKGVSDPEIKRKVVGAEFIKAFEKASKKLGKFEWLAQGTLYTDIIESARGSGSKHESKIKSHHNVGGLPKKLGFKLIEPLKELYKDEVRQVARALDMPEELVEAHPFPGPGLAVRVIGEATKEKIGITREASDIVENELQRAGLYGNVWQAYAFVGDDLATGVKGDVREVGHLVTVRIVESKDAMTADWSKLPFELLERISNRITNEVPGVTWVSYAISSKPPSTIEPQ